jgi:glycosyltransferase involved in cell wall biosynthesis
VCHEKGLHSLVEAWIELNEKKASPSADLLVGGYLRRSEKYYLRELETQISRKRLGDHFEYLGELSLEEKWDFLHSLDVLCLPCLQPESKGLPVLESLACGTPVVLPALGVFPELVEHTGGGILYPPGDRAKLIATLEHLLERPEKAAEMGNRGKTVVQRDFTVDRMAEETIAFYEKLIAEKHADSNPSTP